MEPEGSIPHSQVPTTSTQVLKSNEVVYLSTILKSVRRSRTQANKRS